MFGGTQSESIVKQGFCSMVKQDMVMLHQKHFHNDDETNHNDNNDGDRY